MNTTVSLGKTRGGYSLPQYSERENDSLPENITHGQAYRELEERVLLALETYSNVHRGSGHFSGITTALFERAREVLLEYMGVDKSKYLVIFCSALASELLKAQLKEKICSVISSDDFSLSLGIRAIAVKKSDLPGGVPFQTGGSVARMVSPRFVIWAGAPQRFEAGTPMIVNAIAFAVALNLTRKYGRHCFSTPVPAGETAESILFNDALAGHTGLKLLSEMKKLLVGKGLSVPTTGGHVPFINFDNAASTPTFLPVWEVVKKTWRSPVNVKSDFIAASTKIITGFLGAGKNYDVLFTSNTTEAVNLAASFIREEYRGKKEIVVLNTLLEHNANELPWRYIPGATLIRLPVDAEGFISLELLESVLRKHNGEKSDHKRRIDLVAVSGASNVLGTCNDMEAIAGIAHKYNARLLVDGAQMVAHRKVEIERWGIDYFVFSGHKVYAPFGSGALAMRKSLLPHDISVIQKVRKYGEENVVGIAAMGKAITLLQRAGMDLVEEEERILVKRMLKGLTGINEVKVYGINDPGSAKMESKSGIVSFFVRRGRHQLVARALEVRGAIGLRYGCFCSHMLVKRLLGVTPPLVLLQNVIFTVAPGLSDLVSGLMRVSFGLENDEIEIEQFITILKQAAPISNHEAHQFDAFKENMAAFCKSRVEAVFPT